MNFKEVNKLPIDIKETIKKCISTRSFLEKSLTDDKNKLMDFYKTLTNSFGIDVKVQYISKDKGVENIQLGTYGTIKGAKDFLAITVKDEAFAMEAAGYQFENLVLYAIDMGLGTVWLLQHLAEKTLKILWSLVMMIYFLVFHLLDIQLKNVHLLKKLCEQVLVLKIEKLGLNLSRLTPYEC